MEVIAHRGMPRKARENTLAAFQLAIAAGADGIELDVHATRDGVIVVRHDALLPPAPGAPAGSHGPAIAACTFSELRGEGLAEADIPSLEEVLLLTNDRVTLYVEIKAPGIERGVAELLSGHEHRAAVHSFDHRVAGRVHALSPTLATGLLSSSYLLSPGRILREAAARDYWQWWEMIDHHLVADVHAVGGRVVAWTVNTPDAIRRLATLGVDAICTDVTDEVGAIARAPR